MLYAAAHNPLLPAWYDVVWTSVAAAVFAFLVVALVSIGRTRDVTGLAALVWIVAVLALPVVGGILWFVVGRPRAVGAASES